MEKGITTYTKHVRDIKKGIRLGRAEHCVSTRFQLENISEQNKEDAIQDCLNQLEKHKEKWEQLGVVKIFKEGSYLSYNRYYSMFGHSSDYSVRELLGYKKVTFKKEFPDYKIYTVTKTEKVDSGKFKLTTDYTGKYYNGIEAEKEEQKYEEYYYSEIISVAVVELYVKVVKQKEATKVNKKELEFIAEHDYYLARNRNIPSDQSKSTIYGSYIILTLAMIFAFLTAFSTCFTVYDGDFNFRRFMLTNLPNIASIFKNDPLPYVFVFFGLFVILSVFFIIFSLKLKKITGSKHIIESKKTILNIIFITTCICVFFIVMSILLEDIFVNGLVLKLLLVFLTPLATIYLAIGAFSGGFGAYKKIKNKISDFNSEIEKRRKNGRFDELEKLLKEINSANVKI